MACIGVWSFTSWEEKSYGAPCLASQTQLTHDTQCSNSSHIYVTIDYRLTKDDFSCFFRLNLEGLSIENIR